jgi:hypothetical protein
MTRLRKITCGNNFIFLLFITSRGIAFTIETLLAILGFSTTYVLGIFLGKALLSSILVGISIF